MQGARTRPADQGPDGTMGATAGGAAGASSGAPALIETGRLPDGSPRGHDVSPPVNLPAQSFAPPINAPGAPKADPAKGDGTPVVPIDPESDRQAPVFGYLRFDPPEIPDGGVATLSVGATDDLSGVKIAYGTVRSPGGVAIVPFTAQDEAGSGVLTTRIAIPQKAETGDWYVASLQILDRADNPLILAFAKTSVPQGGVLRVYSQESDSTAPVVHGVSVDKGTVSGGEKNLIVVEVDDDQSGVASVTGIFQNSTKSASIPFSCHASAATSYWEGDVPVPADADCGEWTLQLLRVADKANNTAFLSSDSPQVGRVSFVVAGGGGCDSVPPTLDALYASPAIVSNAAAAEITLTATAHDEGSGVATLFGRVQGPPSTSGQVPRIAFSCTPDPKNPEAPMTTKITVPQYAAKGIWKVDYLQVLDKARNARTYQGDDPALANANFTVE
jgi:hypothetical protein